MNRQQFTKIIRRAWPNKLWLPVILMFPLAAHAELFLLDHGVLQSTLQGQAQFEIPKRDEVVTRRSSHQVVVTASELKARLGLSIGIAWAATELNGGAAKVKLTIRHPEMLTPDGILATGKVSEFETPVVNGVAAGVSGYGFVENYALVPGKWEFQIEINGETVEQKFKLER